MAFIWVIGLIKDLFADAKLAHSGIDIPSASAAGISPNTAPLQIQIWTRSWRSSNRSESRWRWSFRYAVAQTSARDFAVSTLRENSGSRRSM
jgi:hypothetical protein